MQAVKYRRDLNLLLSDPASAICVELGCAEGFNALQMLSWGIAKLYVVDRWESMIGAFGDSAQPQEWHDMNYYSTIWRLYPHRGRYQILRGPTTRMAQHIADRELDMVYIDADHSYEGVKGDIEAYWSKLKTGGVMAFHDYLARQYGVFAAVNEFAKHRGIKIHFIPEDKDEDAGAYIFKA